MPCTPAPIGSVWATGSWSDTAWCEGTWADAGVIITPPIQVGAGSFIRRVEFMDDEEAFVLALMGVLLS